FFPVSFSSSIAIVSFVDLQTPARFEIYNLVVVKPQTQISLGFSQKSSWRLEGGFALIFPWHRLSLFDLLFNCRRASKRN
ncbi:hypothetical protein FRX31_033626, partial [Thalictrum thalictroides]